MKKAMMALALATMSMMSQAALVKVSFEGTNSSIDSPYPNVFGAKVGTVSGYAVYESDTPGTLFSSFNGVTNNYSNALRSFFFEVQGLDGAVLFSGLRSSPTGFGYAQVRDGSVGQDRFSLNNIYLGAADVTGDPAWFSQAQFTLGLGATNAAAISTPDLPDVFDPDIFNGQKNLSMFIARTAGAPGGTTVSFNFNFSSVEVTDANTVPEPAGIALVGAGLLGGLLSRRRRN